MSELALAKSPTQVFVQIQGSSKDSDLQEIEFHDKHNEDSFKEKFWCLVVFLPFSPTWQIFTQLTNTWLILYAIFRAYFYHEFHFFLDVFIYYILEIVFLINTILAYTHRYMTNINKFGLHTPRNIYLLLVDSASLLPFYELVYLVFPDLAESIRDRVRLKVTLRIVHFIFFIRGQKAVKSSNFEAIVLFIHAILVFILTMIGSVIWSWESCWPNCEVENWSDSIKYINVDPEDNLQWFVLCYTYITSLVMHNCTDRTAIEAFYLMLFMLLGFTLHKIYTVGQLIKITLQSLFLEHEYVRLLNQLYLVLENWLDMNNAIRNKVTKFYKLLWYIHGGVIAEPKSVQLIPNALMKEVSMDIFWEMFKHSHTLVDLEIHVKKALSLNMKTEFYMKDDYILRKGVNKHRIVYIVSGIVQVLSIQDDDSAILSFSGGTLLSEISVLYLVNSCSNLRCATDVIIQSLSHAELYKTCQNYVNVSREMRQILHERINCARKKIKSSRTRSRAISSTYKPIQRLKKQWRCIATLNRRTFRKKKIFDHRLYHQIDYSFHSEYLDLLVLSENLELQTSTICLSKSCPYVMDPHSSFRLFLLYIHLIIVTLQCVLVPYNIVFVSNAMSKFQTISFFFDLVYIIDLYVNAITAIKTSSLIITEPIEILLHKFKTVSFLIDIVATIPYDYIALLFNISSRRSLIFKLPRTLKMYKIFNLIKEKQRDLKHNRFFWIIFKYVLLYAIIIYYDTCVMLVLWCFGTDCSERRLTNLTREPPRIDEVISAAEYSFSQILDIGASNRMPSSISEMCFYTVSIFIGMHIYSFFLCEVVCTIIKLSEPMNEFRAQLRICTNFMITYLLPADLRTRVIGYLSFNFFHSLVNDVEMLRESMPDELNQMVMTTTLLNGLKCSPIFSDLSETLLKHLTTCATFRTLPENTSLCCIGEIPLYIHIIRKGYCEMICGMPGDSDKNRKYILKVNDSFPIIEALYSVDSLNTIYTITAVEEICVDIYKAFEIITSHPQEFEIIDKAMKFHFAKYEHLIKGIPKNLIPHKIPPISTIRRKNKRKNLPFSYDINDDQIIIGTRRSRSQMIFRYFAFRSTVDPHHNFNSAWEIFRSAVATLHFIYYMLVDTILLDYYQVNVHVFTFAKIITLMDIFNCIFFTTILFRPYIGGFYVNWNSKGITHHAAHLCKYALPSIAVCLMLANNLKLGTYKPKNRFHLQYYNKDGILITSPKKTVTHYIQTSFLLDLIALLPLYEWNVYRIYAGDYYSILLNISLNCIFFSAILYRPYMGLCYVDWNSKGITHDAAHLCKYALPSMAVCLMLANNLMLGTCKRKSSGYFCTDVIFHKRGTLKELILDNYDLFVVGIFSVTTKFSASFIDLPKNASFFHITEIFSVLVFLWIYNVILTAIITAQALGGSLQMIKYRNSLTNFLTFIKKEMVSEETIDDFTDHFEFLWKKCEGIFLQDLLKAVNESLRVDISSHLFESLLSKTMFFRDMKSTDVQEFLKYMNIQYFKRGAEIIRCNDIQNTLYIVSKGEVDIYMAGSKIITLGQGGTFGCFSKYGYTRQTITAVANMHVDLLTIGSAKFYKLATKYPSVLAKITMNIAAGDEFHDTEMWDVNTNFSLRHAVEHNSSKFERTYNQMFDKINALVNIDSVYYKWYLYALHVHVSPLSCVILLFIQFMQTSYVYIQIYVCMMDLIFYFHMFMNFHLFYVDDESGITIKDPPKIKRKYLKSFLCWVDIFGSMPLELLVYACGVSTHYLHFAMANRLIRIFHLMNYYETSKRTLGLTTFLQCTYICYMIIFQMSVTALFWFLATCGELPCPYTTTEGDGPTIKYITDKLYRTIRSFLYTANMLTYANMPSINPWTYTEVLISIAIQIFSVIFIALVFGAITSLIIINAVSETKFICGMDQMNSYLTNRNLSIFLVKKVQIYFRALWMKRRGEFLPSLIMEAPFYLKQNVMVAMYSHHLHNHKIFKNTHIDFIRQICCHFQLHLYLADQLIVEKGEVELCMFFIHRGEVSRLKDNESTILHAGSAFGERQGLFRVPHQCTFVAHTTVDLLVLNKSDWKYMLKWFPASKEIIYTALGAAEEDSKSSSSGGLRSQAGGSRSQFSSTSEDYFDR